MALDIVYRDSYLAVVNKAAGVPVHATHDLRRPHLQGLLENELGQKTVLHHRLDRDTTGLVVFGLDSSINKAMTDLFRQRHVKKLYWAVVDGTWLPQWTFVETFIDKVYGGRWANVPKGRGGKVAQTHFRLLCTNGEKSLIEASPQTGRTHQIRLHCHYQNHPILGDLNYHPSPIKWEYPIALHARSLSFEHPVTGEPLYFEALLPTYWTQPSKSVPRALEYLSGLKKL